MYKGWLVAGIVQALQKYYASAKTISAYWLASPTDHYSAGKEDRGWGCGYRNLQMLLSNLVTQDEYNSVIFNRKWRLQILKTLQIIVVILISAGKSVIPSISKLQSLIERAWKHGFDPQGAIQLNNRLSGTRTWIGATEIFAVLSSLRARLHNCYLAFE